MEKNFKDLFSTQAKDYLDFRPRYPSQLFTFLKTISKHHDLVWDVGTGNGQAAFEMAKDFKKILATDPSQKQLDHALKASNIVYQLGTAENPQWTNERFDLITVAQAFHWFKHEQFAEVVRKHSKPETHLVVWSYALAFLTPAIDAVVMELYRGILDAYWDPERRHVEDGYQKIQMPFRPVEAPAFSMEAEWKLQHLVGYLMTWSSTQKYIKEHGHNPVESILPKLQAAWGQVETRTIRWPINMKVWKIGIE